MAGTSKISPDDSKNLSGVAIGFAIEDAASVGPNVDAAPHLPIARHGSGSIDEIANTRMLIRNENPGVAQVVGPKYAVRVFCRSVEEDGGNGRSSRRGPEREHEGLLHVGHLGKSPARVRRTV